MKIDMKLTRPRGDHPLSVVLTFFAIGLYWNFSSAIWWISSTAHITKKHIDLLYQRH
jgi:hypothetical protein